MADLDTIKRLRISATDDGIDKVVSALERLGKAYKIVGDGAQTAAVQSDGAAKKLSAPANALDSILARLDPAEKAAQQFAKSINAVARAAEGGYFSKFADGATRLQTVIQGLQREYEKLGSRASGVNIAEAMGLTARNAQESARAYMDAIKAEIERRDPFRAVSAARDAQQRFNQSTGISDRLGRYSSGSAEESAATFQQGFMEQARREARVEMQRREAASAAAGNFQSSLNERLGIRPPSASAQSSAAVFEQDAEAARRLRAEYNQYEAALDRKNEKQKEANGLLARGAIDAKEHATVTANIEKRYLETKRALDGANTSIGKYASGMGLARHEMVNFGRQAQDVFVSLASGQGVMTVLIQQGTQIADIFATSKGSVTGFFGQLISGAARFATSIAGAATGVAAFGVAAAYAGYQYSESQREVERSLIGIGRGSGQTVDSINRVAEAATNAGKISRASAREIASIFVAGGAGGTGLLDAGLLGVSTKGLANATGKSQADAARDLAAALASPTQGVADLEKVFGRLSDAQVQFIRNAEASGNKLDAQRALLAAFNPQLVEAANNTSLLSQAWNAVANGISNAVDALGRYASGSQRATLEQAQQTLTAMQNSRNTYGPLGVSRSAIAEQQAVVAELQEQMRRNGARSSEAARDAASSNLSRSGGDVLRGLFGDESRLKDLENQLSVLKQITNDSSALAKLGPLGRLAAEGVERLKSSIDNFQTTNQKIARDAELQVQSINAYTLNQRAAVEAERARVAALDAGRGALQAGIEAEQARSRVIAEANRQLRDTARDLRDQASLIGKSPFERSMQEARNTARREAETLATGAGTGNTALDLPQTSAAVRGMDAAFSENLRKLMAAVPGLGVTSGFRSYEEQARLYAEKGPGWAARPGTSNHEKGIAADLNYNGSGQIPAWVRELAQQFNIAFPLANRSRNPEPWHAEPAGGRRSGASNDNVAGATATASSVDAARQANILKEIYEGWNTPLANANRQLDAQIALQGRAQQTWLMSTGEITKAAEAQRLVNEYNSQGIPITESLRAAIDAYATRAGQAAEQAKQFAEAQKGFREIGDTLKGSLGSFISDIRNGVSGAEALRNSLNRIADKLIDMALQDLFSKAFGNNSGGSGLMSFIGNLFGASSGGSSIGTTPGSGGLYADGGYTGHGTKWQPAGVVHKGEVVWSQADVSRAGGVGVVEAMRRGLPGYAEGGSPGYRAAANSNGSSGGGTQVNIYAPNAKVSKKENADGSLDVYVDQAEGNMARKVAQRRGALHTSVQMTMNGGNLRG